MLLKYKEFKFLLCYTSFISEQHTDQWRDAEVKRALHSFGIFYCEGAAELSLLILYDVKVDDSIPVHEACMQITMLFVQLILCFLREVNLFCAYNLI